MNRSEPVWRNVYINPPVCLCKYQLDHNPIDGAVGLVVSYIVAIDVTRVRFPDGATSLFVTSRPNCLFVHSRRDPPAPGRAAGIPALFLLFCSPFVFALFRFVGHCGPTICKFSAGCWRCWPLVCGLIHRKGGRVRLGTKTHTGKPWARNPARTVLTSWRRAPPVLQPMRLAY